MVKIGIVGVGYEIGIAQFHVKAYQLMEDATITAVYDVIPARAQEYITRFGLHHAVCCESYEQLLGLVDAVSICTPNSTHVPLAIQAIEANKHVLCEKPFAPSAEDCAALVTLSKNSSTVQMIGLCYRGIPAYRMLKDMIKQGELGEIYYTRQSMGGGRIGNPTVELEWRMQKELSGPGAIADFGSHMLDLCDWILSETYGKLQEFSCMAGTFIKERKRQDDTGESGIVTNDDVAQFIAKTTGGVLCSFNASRIGGNHTFEIFGSKGQVSFTGNSFAINKIISGPAGSSVEVVEVTESSYLGAPEQARVPFLINFYQEIREFLDLIQNGGETEIDFARGHYIQQLIDAVQQAADEGKTVTLKEVQA